MTTVNDINTCLSTYPNDPIQQVNCTRVALGYPKVTATSEIVSPCNGITISNNCISQNMLLIGGIGLVLLYILSKRR